MSSRVYGSHIKDIMDNDGVNMKDALEKAIETIVRVSEPDKIILFGSYAKRKQKRGVIMTFWF